jgi:3-hydroxyacyl-CoA dehydrogenase
MPIDEIKNICFVGAGTMGCFNPLVSALAGYQAILYDSNEETLKHVPERQNMLGKAMIERWSISEEELKIRQGFLRIPGSGIYSAGILAGERRIKKA